MKQYLYLLLLLFLACDNIPWSKEDRELFVTSCMSGANDSLKSEINIEEYCSCVQQKLEAEYSIQQIKEQDIIMKDYLQMQMDCLEEQHHHEIEE